MSTLQIVPMTPQRPADLIRVAVPRLNKQDHISAYLEQLESRDYDLNWARVTERKVLNCSEWNDFMGSLLSDREWLAERGGADSWADCDFNHEREEWIRCSFLLVVAVSCGGQTVYVDPEGYNYARYMAFAAGELPEGKTREQMRKEAAERELVERAEELKKRIENPPSIAADHGLRFFWNGIKYGGQLHKAHYSIGKPLGLKNVHYPEETITVYARDYVRFPKHIAGCFYIENNTDSQSDYFDDDKFRVCPNHPLYSVIKEAYDAQEAHYIKVREGRETRRASRRGSVGIVLLTWITFAIGAGALLASFLDYVGVR